MNQRVFPIAPVSAAATWLCAVIGLLPLGLGAFLGTFAFFGSRIVTLEVSQRELRVHGDVYARSIPYASLKVPEAAAFNPAAEPGRAVAGRVNGIGLPNYRSGWFRLRDGTKALLFVTDWSRAVLVPTTESFDLLVSPADPRAFLAALAHPAASGATFPLAAGASPVGSALSWLLLALCVALPLAITGLIGYVAYSTRAARFEISGEGLRIRGDMFGRLIPRGSLQVSSARIVDLKREPGLRPSIRTCGVGLPGYLSGWVRLKDRTKGLVFLTNSSRVVYLPTTDGYTLLLSPTDPEGFLEALTS